MHNTALLPMNGGPLAAIPTSLVDTGRFVVTRLTSAESILPLRHRTLRDPDRPIDEARFDGDDRAGNWHFALIDNSLPKENPAAIRGCISFLFGTFEPTGELAWEIRGIVILEQHMHDQSLGSLLLTKTMNAVADDSRVRVFWCNAPDSSVVFYAQHGWQQHGHYARIGKSKIMYKRFTPMLA